jgi:hypothetical protein
MGGGTLIGVNVWITSRCSDRIWGGTTGRWVLDRAFVMVVVMVVVVVLAFEHEPGLGNGKNGEGGKDMSETNLHGWRRRVVAVSVGVKPAEMLPVSLYALWANKSLASVRLSVSEVISRERSRR